MEGDALAAAARTRACAEHDDTAAPMTVLVLGAARHVTERSSHATKFMPWQ